MKRCKLLIGFANFKTCGNRFTDFCGFSFSAVLRRFDSGVSTEVS